MTPRLKEGDRVRYTGTASWLADGDQLIGTVIRLYAAFDEDTLEPIPYPRKWRVSIRLDKVPFEWPYPGTDRFAPAVEDVEKIS